MLINMLIRGVSGRDVESFLDGAVLTSSQPLDSWCDEEPNWCALNYPIEDEFHFKTLYYYPYEADLTIIITLAEEKEIQTVFVNGWYFNPSDIRIGNDPDVAQNSICAADFTDSGFLECPIPLKGKYVSFKKKVPYDGDLEICTIRLFNGVNVIQYATVYEEPKAASSSLYRATNLLRMYPTVNYVYEQPQYIPGDDN